MQGKPKGDNAASENKDKTDKANKANEETTEDKPRHTMPEDQKGPDGVERVKIADKANPFK